MALIDRVHDLPQADLGKYMKFCVEGHVVGYIAPAICEHLHKFNDVFVFQGGKVVLSERIGTYDERSRMMNSVLRELIRLGALDGWRGESLPVTGGKPDRVLFEMDRAGIPKFGFRGFGIHLNGCVRNDDYHKMWLSRRSQDRPTEPGKLDQLVAGGLPARMGIRENLIKEGWEEAGMAPIVLEKAVPAGLISYDVERPEGLRRDIIFIFDIFLDDTFTPNNVDKEVDDFMLVDVNLVLDILACGNSFKFNSSIVCIDYMIRHGILDPEYEDYIEIAKSLRR